MDLTLGHTRLLVGECERQDLLRNQAAYVLATAFWETARTMKPVVEAFWKTDAWRRQNLRYYPWHGRGFVQLTWEKNYQRAARETGQPLDKNPDLALQPDIAAAIIVAGMREGWFTGKKLADYRDAPEIRFRQCAPHRQRQGQGRRDRRHRPRLRRRTAGARLWRGEAIGRCTVHPRSATAG